MKAKQDNTGPCPFRNVSEWHISICLCALHSITVSVASVITLVTTQSYSTNSPAFFDIHWKTAPTKAGRAKLTVTVIPVILYQKRCIYATEPMFAAIAHQHKRTFILAA